MSTSLILSEIRVLNEHGTLILEIQNQIGQWTRLVFTESHYAKLSVTGCPLHYKPEGVTLGQLLPDSVDDPRGQISVLAQKLAHLIGESADLMSQIQASLPEGVLAEEFDHACAGD